MWRHWILSLCTFLALAVTLPAQAEGTLRVAYAGSMGAVMDRFLGPTFAKKENVEYQGIGQGAYGLARLLESRQMQADVFISITPGPIEILQKAGMIDQAVPVASTQMVIVYSPKSRFAPDFAAAAAGRMPWYQVLEMPGLRLGRTDPAVDPQGQNIIFTMLLAEKYYHQPDLVKRIFGAYVNPEQIFAEPSLVSRLESGQLDATSGYESAAISHHLPFVRLPAQINLSDPAMIKDWYSQVHFQLTLPNGRTADLQTQPLVFYAAVLKNAQNPVMAQDFVRFLQSPEGQKIFRENGYSRPKGGNI